MGKNFLIMTAVFLACGSLHSQVTDPLSFFPHHLGDMWEYFVFYGVGIPSDTLQVRVTIDSTDDIGNIHVKHYLQVINPNSPPPFPWYDQYRIDTTLQVFAGDRYFVNRLQYKLDAQIGEMWIANDWGGGYDIAKVRDIYPGTLFGMPTTFKEIWYYGTSDTSDTTIWLWHYIDILADGFGVIYHGSPHHGFILYLMGAYINGILYGDTTVVSVENFQYYSLPNQVQLSQNYPNPFNVSTVIEFLLSSEDKVQISIYNILGRLVTRLVDERMEVGRHRLIFDGSSLPSGIYIVRMHANDRMLSRKITLMK